MGWIEGAPNRFMNDLGSANAAVNAAAKTASFGMMPQIQGAGQAAVDTVTGLATGQGLGSLDDLKASYQKGKQDALDVEARSAKNHPIANAVGTLGGMFLAPDAAGFAGERLGRLGLAQYLPQATTKLGKLALATGKAGAGGALTGAIINPGEDPNDSLQLAARGKNALLGTGLGMAAEPLVQGAEAAPGAVDSIRNWMASKQLGATPRQLQRLISELPDYADRGIPEATRLNQLEKYMDQNNMLDVGSNFGSVVNKSSALMKERGSNLSDIYAGVQGSLDNDPALSQDLSDTALHGPDLADEFLAQEKQNLAGVRKGDDAYEQIANSFGTPENPKDLRKMGPDISLPDMHSYRQTVDDQIPFNADDTGKLVAQSNKRLRTFLQSKMEGRIGAVDEATGAENLAPLQKANQDYSDAATINGITKQTEAREMSKAVVPLLGAGGVGLTEYSRGESLPRAIIKGVASGLALRGARALGPALTYRAATGLEPYLGQFAQQAQSLAPKAIVPWALMQQQGGNQ